MVVLDFRIFPLDKGESLSPYVARASTSSTAAAWTIVATRWAPPWKAIWMRCWPW